MIKSLTSLRGIFILFIFLHHCPGIYYAGGGTMAVTFFFVLGGFCMTLGYKEKLQSLDFNYKNYLATRAIKFYPLHWICLLAALPLSLRSFGIKEIGLIGVNAALLQSWVPLQSVYFSFNWLSWYLCDTMFFAIMFPALCRMITSSGKKGKAAIAATIACLYTVVATLIPTDMYRPILYIYPLIRLADFVFGIYLALAFMGLKEKSKPAQISSTALQVISILLIVFLVIESCYLSDNARRIAPLYWPFVGALIVSASLLDAYGGGGSKTNGYYALGN